MIDFQWSAAFERSRSLTLFKQRIHQITFEELYCPSFNTPWWFSYFLHYKVFGATSKNVAGTFLESASAQNALLMHLGVLDAS